MKLLKIITKNYKNCEDNFSINFTTQSKKTSEDKLYELQEIDTDLYAFNTMAFVGKNASGKTSVMNLIDCCYSILSTFHLSNKHFDYDGIEITLYFYHNNKIYKYYTKLKNDLTGNDSALFVDQKLSSKKFYKTKIKEIFDDNFDPENIAGNLPDDTSILFFVLNKSKTRAIYFDCYGKNEDTYSLIFKAMKNYKIPADVLLKVIKIFDESISSFSMVDEHNFKININNDDMLLSDKELLYRLSSGTTKGVLLYIQMYASLKYGFDLLIDEIENHFHKTLVENMLMLYKDKATNKKNASLMFTTHYCELLDLFNRSDNIWILTQDTKIRIKNLYNDFDIRNDILKSKKFYENVFNTAVNYNNLMDFKKVLLKNV